VYGLQFYSELRRVLTKDGTLFHYIGNPESKESGRLYQGITQRLQEAGFVNVKKAVKAFGLVAQAGGGVRADGAADGLPVPPPKGRLLRRPVRRRSPGGEPEEEEVADDD